MSFGERPPPWQQGPQQPLGTPPSWQGQPPQPTPKTGASVVLIVVGIVAGSCCLVGAFAGVIAALAPPPGAPAQIPAEQVAAWASAQATSVAPVAAPTAASAANPLEQQLSEALAAMRHETVRQLAQQLEATDPARAVRLRANAAAFEALDSCTPGRACVADTLRRAQSDGADAQYVTRAREACRDRYGGALLRAPAALRSESAAVLRATRDDLLCLFALGGSTPVSPAQFDEAIARLEAPAPFEGGYAGGYRSGRGGGRCRDSRGRFTRCY